MNAPVVVVDLFKFIIVVDNLSCPSYWFYLWVTTVYGIRFGVWSISEISSSLEFLVWLALHTLILHVG